MGAEPERSFEKINKPARQYVTAASEVEETVEHVDDGLEEDVSSVNEVLP
jgi:hypothetical protein